jgi:hypothetical protein
MKNIELNPGGLIGALACGASVGAYIFWNHTGGDFGRAQSKFLIGAFIGGAFAGNFLWQLVFKKSEEKKFDSQAANETHPPQ